MNHQNRLTKAYNGLNAEQLATLAFHYLAEANDQEIERLVSAVPMKEYRCLDVVYLTRVESLTQMATFWTIEHWRWRCINAEKLAGVLAAFRRAADDEQLDALINALEASEKCLLALDAALNSVCSEHGIDPADVRKIAETKPYISMRKGMTPDPDMMEAMRASLKKIVKPAAAHTPTLV